MRLFIALELPSAIRDELVSVQERMRSTAPPVRWVVPENMHLTLQFLGETPPERLAGLKAALADLAVPDITLHLGPLGAFPHLFQPAVVWVGLAGDVAALRGLQATVCAATAARGFAHKERSFYPHLTLGRVREGLNQLRLEALGATLERSDPPRALAWAAGRPLLFESTLTPQGPIYTRP
ncbi:MAG: RNA 2',3'-cyclic phosphodiesterase [Candidatus Viridilinea halotolerans]|uniref:RNA 2',3'-cyclic phosphodiesterase n=1 Tax=Candidatus Viridilinea halotolerans TaxID=2491704 RepID=A0A426U9S8_9CHLR|nr:MAG: RNA 2',3'-cyclic phosphodiesterase [Candidatus Viridilinea halotolerans]